MLNSRRRLGKQTSDLKITFVKFTYPGQLPYIPSLPHFLLITGDMSATQAILLKEPILPFFGVGVCVFVDVHILVVQGPHNSSEFSGDIIPSLQEIGSILSFFLFSNRNIKKPRCSYHFSLSSAHKEIHS